MALSDWTDQDLRDVLRKIDEDSAINCTPWEAEFIESVCYAETGRKLSEKQRHAAYKMINKYDYLE